MLNPSTYLGLLKLGVISAKVATGRSVGRHPLSKADAA
jgi:triacylglycerol lipase